MTTQQRSRLVEPHVIDIEETTVPDPGPGQVLIEVAAVGICGSDVHYFEHGRIADFVVEQPLVLGHEASGTIRAVGEGVPDDRIGQRVAMEPQETCGRCRQCQAGRYNLCPDVEFFATPPIHGAFAQYVVLAAHRAHPVPDTPLRRGGGADRTAVGRGLGRPQGRRRTRRAGAGHRRGPGRAALRRRRARPRRRGDRQRHQHQPARRGHPAWRPCVVDATAGPLSEQLEPFDVIIECSGAAPAVRGIFDVAGPAARIVLVGMGAPSLELPVAAIQIKELRVTGTFRYANCYPAAISLAATGAVDLDGLVTARFGLAEVADALQAFKRDPTTLKPIVYPGR